MPYFDSLSEAMTAIEGKNHLQNRNMQTVPGEMSLVLQKTIWFPLKILDVSPWKEELKFALNVIFFFKVPMSTLLQ